MATAMGKAFGRSLKKGKMVAQPSYAPWGSIVNAQVKAKVPPPSSSNLSKFLGLPPPPNSQFLNIVSKFVKIQAGRSPGRKKTIAFDEKLRAALAKEKGVGVHDIAKMMSDVMPPRGRR